MIQMCLAMKFAGKWGSGSILQKQGCIKSILEHSRAWCVRHGRKQVIHLKLLRFELYFSPVSPEWHPGPVKSHSLMFMTDTEAHICSIMGRICE